jgi:hypothetical protein
MIFWPNSPRTPAPSVRTPHLDQVDLQIISRRSHLRADLINDPQPL